VADYCPCLDSKISTTCYVLVLEGELDVNNI
jgi:hypothetical protein